MSEHSEHNELVETGVAGFTIPGENVTGDRHVTRTTPDGLLIAVVDGLGHGEEAGRAAEIAIETVRTSKLSDVSEIIGECHERLRSTRGVVMTIASFAAAAGTLSCAGVGNVQGMFAHTANGAHNPTRDFLLLRAGVVGHILPPVRVSPFKVERGDTLVFATDGVSIEFTTARRLHEPPQPLARRLLSDYASRTDDALVLVARFMR